MGILHNELYIGRRVWNRFTWIRSAADSSKRRIVLNPEVKWIVHEREDLRIVSQKLWDRVRLRHSEQSKSIGYRVKQGLDKAKKTNRGRMPRYLLSGLLECPDCGGGYTIVSRGHYGCSAHRNGGAAACPNATKFKRVDAENALLAGLKEELLTDASVEYARKAIVKIVRERSKAKSASDNRRQALEVEITNLSHAIVDEALKSSPAIIDPHLWMSVFGYQPSNRSMSLGDWFPIQSTTFLAVNSNSRAEPAPRSIH